MLPKITPNLRMAGGLTLLCFAAMLVGSVLGLFPNSRKMRLQSKTTLAESLAISCSLMAQRDDYSSLQENLRAVVERNPHVLSAALRDNDGQVVISSGDHEEHWRIDQDSSIALDNVFLPIINASGDEWGQIEVAFAEHGGLRVLGIPLSPFLLFASIVCITCYLFYVAFLMRVLSVLNPSKAVPQRVRAALDTLAEGLVILGTDQRITLVNRALENKIGTTTDKLIGKRLDDLPGMSSKIKSCLQSAQSGVAAKGTMLRYKPEGDENEITFLVNATPILGEDGSRRGVLASFEDITELESQKRSLQAMLARLTQSREHVQRQNVELMRLATTDSLTGCLNRRTFFEHYHKLWQHARSEGVDLHCAMVDVDFFKSVNDNHGHSAGDKVLRAVAETLRKLLGEPHLVCRYGGEEFCALIMTQTCDEAIALAERVRSEIESLEFEGLPLKITASLGVSSTMYGSEDPEQILDEADKSLYFAKRSGRNRVVSWNTVPDDVEVEESAIARTIAKDIAAEGSIPFPAVACLLSALAYRDADTAAHSRRVADLVFAVARECMPLKESYVVEIAALLHDIGKIGVPDSILLKPGKLTAEEWEIMHLHDRIGVEIVAAAFENQDLVNIIHSHHAKFDGSDGEDMPIGCDIPLGARILAVADAYDAMVSDRVYRRGMPVSDAINELRRCAGTHFDPEVVESFIETIEFYRPNSTDTSCKQAAIQLGLQVENLAGAMDKQDVEGIRAIASHVAKTAAKHGLPDVQQLAEDIEALAVDDPDMIELVDAALSLVDVCRATRTSYTDVPDTRASVRPAEPAEC